MRSVDGGDVEIPLPPFFFATMVYPPQGLSRQRERVVISTKATDFVYLYIISRPLDQMESGH